uniref:Uncharacterized protein n=1 Tax=Rhizophora mucronata TaxID=61149 RepID=A0A2P2PYA6_RHIMU
MHESEVHPFNCDSQNESRVLVLYRAQHLKKYFRRCHSRFN